MTGETFLGCLIVASAAYRMTRLIVLDTLLDEPRMWVLRKLAVRPRLDPARDPRWLVSRRPRGRVRTKLAEGLQCTFCVGVWVTTVLAAAWFTVSWARWPIIFAGICGLQALLHSWEGEG